MIYVLSCLGYRMSVEVGSFLKFSEFSKVAEMSKISEFQDTVKF